MDDNKNTVIKTLLIIVGILLIAAITVFTIILCSDYKFYIDWDWGSFFGGVVTLGGVGLTLWGTTRNYKKKIMPYIVARVERKPTVITYSLQRRYYALETSVNKLEFKSELKISEGDKIEIFIIKNEGLAPAKNIKLKAENKANGKLENLHENLSLNTGEEYILWFKTNIIETYNIEISYNNFDYSNKYFQKGEMKTDTDYNKMSIIELLPPKKAKKRFFSKVKSK